MPTILIADEAGLFVALETTPVLRAGCTLVAIHSTQELLASASTRSPDLFLLDADFLGRGTRSCLRSLKADRRLASVPIVIAARDTADLDPVLTENDVSFAKPISPEAVGAALKRLLPIARRGSRRVPVSINVTCKVGGRTVKLRTKDVGAGGFFLKTSKGMPRGTRFEASFSLPGEEPGRKDALPLTATCEVVRLVEPEEDDRIPGFGAVFVALPETAGKILRQFVSSRAA